MMKNMKKSMKVKVMKSLSLNNGMENATEKIMESRVLLKGNYKCWSKFGLNYTSSVSLPNPLLRGNELRTLLITSQVESKTKSQVKRKIQNLKQRYKRIKRNNSRIGRSFKTFKFCEHGDGY